MKVDPNLNPEVQKLKTEMVYFRAFIMLGDVNCVATRTCELLSTLQMVELLKFITLTVELLILVEISSVHKYIETQKLYDVYSMYVSPTKLVL